MCECFCLVGVRYVALLLLIGLRSVTWISVGLLCRVMVVLIVVLLCYLGRGLLFGWACGYLWLSGF